MNELAGVAATFGPYRTLRVIGRGGVAVVVEAVHEPTGRRVAIKALSGVHADQPTIVARFEREARIIAHLRHPNVVTAFDVGFEGGQPYLVMELLEGETLAARLGRSVRLGLEEIAAIFLPVCTAIASAHAAGIIHRDLKPSNVMLARAPSGIVPKVLDFGVSKIEAGVEADLTQDGSVLGTMRYLSPEQAFSGAVGPPSDVYALGMMLFECATGRGPFGSRGYDVVQALIRQKPAPPPRAIAPELPIAFDAVVLRALRRDPAERFPTALALAKELLAFAHPATRAGWERAIAVAEGPVRGSTPPPPEPVEQAPEPAKKKSRYGAAIFSRSFWTMFA